MSGAIEEDLLAELFIDLKGPKKKRDDWINIAKKCKELAKLSGSVENAAEKLGVSYELFRSIITLLTLPKEVQKLVRDYQILYDAAQRLYRIRHPRRQIEVAKAIAGLTSHQQREIIQYAVRYPNSQIDDFKRRVAKPKTITERIHVVVIPIREETFKVLYRRSTKNKLSVERMILKIIEEWKKREDLKT